MEKQSETEIHVQCSDLRQRQADRETDVCGERCLYATFHLALLPLVMAAAYARMESCLWTKTFRFE